MTSEPDSSKSKALMSESNTASTAEYYCLNCGSNEYTSVYDAFDFDTGSVNYPIVRCQKCGLCYTAQVTDKILEAAYSKQYYGSGKKKFLSILESIVQIGHRRQAKKIVNSYYALQQNSHHSKSTFTMLDIGCGRGLLMKALTELGGQCLGIERQEFSEITLDAGDIHIGALSDTALADRKFDIIVIWHVLEHIQELGTLFNELPKHLNSGGLLVISVPNFSSWQSGLFKQNWFHLDLPRHISHFEKTFLTERLSLLDFEIIDFNTLTISQNIYGFLQSSLNRLFPKKPNRLYRLLTCEHGLNERLTLIGWVLLATLIFPFALGETILAHCFKRGATLTVYAKKK